MNEDQVCGTSEHIVIHRTVVISQTFFAHYRAALMKMFLRSGKFTYVLAGADHDVGGTGIHSWLPDENMHYIKLTTWQFAKRFWIQPGLISLALRKDIQAIIYPGDAKYITTWISAAIARLTGKNVLFWTHGWLHQERGIKAEIRRRFFRLSNCLLLYGNRAKQIGIAEGFDPARMYVVYNSLDYQTQKDLRAKVTAEETRALRTALFGMPDRPLLICVARLTKKRKLDLLLSAMSLLKTRGCPVNLILVGDGPERANLEKMAQEMSLSVAFVGECYSEADLCRYIMAANVTVVPGAIGLTAIQSLVYGVPVITNNNLDEQMPEVEAIIPGVSGDFFVDGAEDDLADVIEHWAARKQQDQELRKRCWDIIDRFYNPDYQMRVFEAALSGTPADDMPAL